MDTEERLRQLELRYRSLLSACVAAKARFLAVDGEAAASPVAVSRARVAWEDLERRKSAIVVQMRSLEILEQA